MSTEANITLESAKYSLKYLNDIIDDYINMMFYYESMETRPQIIDCIGGYSLREDLNRVMVWVLDLDEEKSEEFKMYISDSPAFLLENVDAISPGEYL